jgi:hypothetical protein
MTDKFQAKKKTLSCNQLLFASPEKVFPLLCPTREYDWIAPWACELIYSKSGFAELDCVFTTNFPGEVKETWIVDKYEINKLIQFIRFSESRIIKYCIELIDNNNETTHAIWTQTVISLNSEGNSFIDDLSVVEYDNEIKTLEKMLNHYIKTSRRLELDELQ